MAENVNNTVDADVPADASTQLPETTETTTTPEVTENITSTTNTEPTVSPTPTADVQTDITVQEPTVPTAEEAITAGIEATQQRAEDLPIQTQDRLTEEAAQRDEQLEQTKEFAQERQDIIQDQDAAIAETEQEIQDLSQQRAVRDAEILTSVQDAAIEKANLAVEEQKLSNQIAEMEAEQKIETAKQQSTWAFNKLGLGFSSGIILEVQRIATKGATELARVKVTGAKALADSKLQVAKLEAEYATEINRTIDKYTDLGIANKQNSIKRIADTQNNLLLNNQQKEEQINKIKESYKTETRKLEDDMRKEQERLADKQIQQTLTLEQQVTSQQNQEKSNINRQFENGSWFTLTDRQRGLALQKAGLGLEEGKAMENTMFSKTITSEVASAVGSNVTLTGDDRKSIQNLATSYMEGGLVFSEATKRATLDYIDSTPRLARVKEIQDAKLKAALTPSSGTSTKKGKPTTKVNEKGEFVSVDPVTGESFVIRDEEGNPTLAPVKEQQKSFAEQLVEAQAALEASQQ